MFEACRSCGDLVCGCGFNSVFECDAGDDFGQVIRGGSRNFGPLVKVDRMMREVIQNEETKEPFARVQSQGCA